MSETTDLSRAIAILTEDDPPRVWSFIVTIFGDLAQGEGDALSGRLLARMAEAASLRPETVRVALHRLRKDGWIESHRDGRRSHYTLTSYGRDQSAAAAPRIYAPTAPEPKGWTVLFAEPGAPDDGLADVASRTEAVALGSFGLLVPEDVDPVDRGLFRIRAGAVDLPDWIRAVAGPVDLRLAYDRLNDRLQRVRPLLQGDKADLQSAATRVLVVHSWRRVLLRHPDLPSILLPANWPGETCRSAVMDILAQLPRPDLETLEALADV